MLNSTYEHLIIIKILNTESLYHQYSETIYQFTQEMSLGAANEFR